MNYDFGIKDKKNKDKKSLFFQSFVLVLYIFCLYSKNKKYEKINFLSLLSYAFA